MHIRCIQNRSTRLLVGLLLVPALALRVLVPPGFMPGTGAGDAPTMQMCHGAGPLPASTQPMPGATFRHPGRASITRRPASLPRPVLPRRRPTSALALDAPHVDYVGTLTPEFIFVQKALHRAQAARAPPGPFPLA